MAQSPLQPATITNNTRMQVLILISDADILSHHGAEFCTTPNIFNILILFWRGWKSLTAAGAWVLFSEELWSRVISPLHKCWECVCTSPMSPVTTSVTICVSNHNTLEYYFRYLGRSIDPLSPAARSLLAGRWDARSGRQSALLQPAGPVRRIWWGKQPDYIYYYNFRYNIPPAPTHYTTCLWIFTSYPECPWMSD